MAYSQPLLDPYYGLSCPDARLNSSFYCESGYGSANHSRQTSYEISGVVDLSPEGMDPLSPFDLSAVAASLPGHHGNLVRTKAEVQTCVGERMSPSVFNHAKTLSSCSSSMQGRASPAYDLGYHTLLSRSPAACLPSHHRLSPAACLPSHHRLSPSPWTDLPTSGTPQRPSSTVPYLPGVVCPPRDSPRPQLPDPPSQTELMLTMYKGKRSHHKPAPFDRLSDELMLLIFGFLSTDELCCCSRVCRRWYFLAWEPQLWGSITLSGEQVAADRALRQIVRLLSRDNPGALCHTVERAVLNGCTRLTDRGLTALARRCPQLRHLELRGCSGVSNQAVYDLVAHCPALEHLDVTGCHRITCIEMSPLLQSTQRQLYLQYLDLTDCHNLTDQGLKMIVRNCPQLQHLYLRRCEQITDAGVKSVPSYCVNLREFSISDCCEVTDYSLRELARLGPSLRYLSVAKCDRISDAGIRELARACYKLRYLNVRGCEAISDSAMEVVARGCQRLRALDIGKCDVTDHGLKMLSQNCPNLKKLSVKSCEMITDAGIRFIAYYCRGLQQLNIQDCPVTVEGYRTVKKYCKRCIIEHTNPGFF